MRHNFVKKIMVGLCFCNYRENFDNYNLLAVFNKLEFIVIVSHKSPHFSLFYMSCKKTLLWSSNQNFFLTWIWFKSIKEKEFRKQKCTSFLLKMFIWTNYIIVNYVCKVIAKLMVSFTKKDKKNRNKFFVNRGCEQ